MSLLIDVLTKADQANSDTADRESTAPPDADVTADAHGAQAPEVEPELSLAPERDAASAAAESRADAGQQPAEAAIAAADNGDSMAAATSATQEVAQDAPAPGKRGTGRSGLGSIVGSRLFQLGVGIGAATLLGLAMFADDWLLSDAPAPVDYAAGTDATDSAIEPERPPSTAGTPTPDPAQVGPPIDRRATEAPANVAVLVADVPDDPEPDLSATTEPASPARIVIQKNNRDDPVHLHMRRAYGAFREGDYTGAIEAYRLALEADPLNQDALLGLAALALRTGDAQQAAQYFEATLDLDPQNSVAIAGLVALQEGGSAIDRESFLKNMLYERPTAAHLHFSLGIQYASQARWSDAQQAFFDAFSHDPTNADYAFNLAVSLDRLGQARSAADYYRRSLNLASGNHVIDTTAAQRRLDALLSSDGDD